MTLLTSFAQSVITLVVFALMLGVLVVVHELGHFIAARLAGVRVLEFGIGFPPRARILRSTGDTLYTLNWLPIGGFVKLEGEEGVIEGQSQADGQNDGQPAGRCPPTLPSIRARSPRHGSRPSW